MEETKERRLSLRHRAAGKLSHSVTSTTVNNALARSRNGLYPHFQMAAKNTAGTDLDCVEDSEPERKRIRLQAAETKKRRTRRKPLEPRRETTVPIVARGSSPASPFSQIPAYPCPVDNNTTGLGYFFSFDLSHPNSDVYPLG